MTTPFQPQILTPVTAFTEAEANYADEEPPGLFPDNQNSNWGLRRKVFSDQMQQVVAQLAVLYQEIFSQTSDTYIDRWEQDLGIPVAVAGKTLDDRRRIILSRIRVGPFTRTARREIVESYIYATFGETVSLTPSGVPLTSGGVSLYGETSSVAALYNIVEDIPNFSYQVRIKDTVTEDTVGLTRDLARVTPAHISFTIVHVATP